MKVGDRVELADEEGGALYGTIVGITILVESDDGEEYEIPVEEAAVPELEGEGSAGEGSTGDGEGGSEKS